MQSQQQEPAPHWDSVVFVWAVWSGALLSALRVAYGARKYPFTDDWILAPVLAGDQPVTLGWLWQQHGDHRIPLVRLVFLALYNRFTGADFRIGVLFNVAALALLAAGMILVAQRLRGYTTYSDAFFPFALLQRGLWAVWWSFGVHYVCWQILATGLLLIVVQHTGRLSVGYALLATGALVLLPMCGSIGLALVPALALWLFLAGAHEGRSPNGNRRAAVVAVVGGVAAVSVALTYLVGLQMTSEYRSESLLAALKLAGRFLSAGFGFAFAEIPSFPWQLIMPCLVVGSLGGLAAAVRFNSSEWRRGLGLVLFLGAMGCLGLALGVGRGGLPSDTGGFDHHYGLLALPFLTWTYFVWCAYYGSRPIGHLVQMTLFLVMCVVFVLNFFAATYLSGAREAEDHFEADVRAGLPIETLTERHLALFWWPQHTDEGKRVVADGMRALRRTGVAPFRFIPGD